jgi:organic hydroperoxide reductase OsmC/OhrA
MKPLPHLYSARIAGGPTGYATLSSSGVPDLRTAPPLDFEGPGDAWSPEQLLLAAIEACFLLTFRSVAQASRLEFVSRSVEAEGVVEPSASVSSLRRSTHPSVSNRRSQGHRVGPHALRHTGRGRDSGRPRCGQVSGNTQRARGTRHALLHGISRRGDAL